MSVARAKEFVSKKSDWIKKQQDYFDSFTIQTKITEVEDGDDIFILGKQYTVRVFEHDSNRGVLNGNYLDLFIKSDYVDNYEYTFTNSVELPNGKKIYVDNSTKDGSNYVYIQITPPFPLEVGTYTLTGCPSGGSNNNYRLSIFKRVNNENRDEFREFGTGREVVVSEASDYILMIVAYRGIDLGSLTYYPMVRLSTEDATFAPYENIRPFINYDAINIIRSGKNLLKLEYKTSVPSINTGYDVNASGWASDYINIGDNIVTLSRNDATATAEMYLFLYDENKNYIGYVGNAKAGANLCSNKITGYENAKYCRVRMSDGSSSSIRLQLEIGETATAYEPYKGETFTLSLGDTYYGGSVNWNTGELIADKATYIATGSDNQYWEKIDASSTDGLSYYFTNIAFANTINVDGNTQKCSHYQYGYVISNNNTQNRFRIYTPTGGQYVRFCIRPDVTAYPDLTSWKAYLKEQYDAGTPVQVVYTLTEPIKIQLDSSFNIQTLDGINTIFGNPTTNNIVDFNRDAYAPVTSNNKVPVITYSTIDLIAGESLLAEGEVYLVYE